MLKQVIVIRKDLNMRKGKMVSQGAHASMKVFFDRISGYSMEGNALMTDLTVEMIEWINGSFTKICLSCNSEEELVSLFEQAEASRLPCSLIEDNGLTEFGGVKTKTAIAIGPAKAEDIDKITGGLSLL